MSTLNQATASHSSRGITLLEVLIACGVLVLGLASVAALLPAAGARLGQATVEDRGGVLAANAWAEIQLRGLASESLFPFPKPEDAIKDPPLPKRPAKALAFGPVLNLVPDMPAAADFFELPLNELPSKEFETRVHPLAFMLEDEVLFQPPTTAETPLNWFVDDLRRSFKEALRWGATLAPTKPESIGAVPGATAILAIAVFRGESIPQAISLRSESNSGGLYQMTLPNQGLLKSHLRGCSYVLAMPTASDTAPRWFKITASWKPPPSPDLPNTETDDNCYVIFADPYFEDFAGSEPTVIAFDKLVRVDQYTVTLE